MDYTTQQHSQPTPEEPSQDMSVSAAKHPWQEPKLAFVEPKLTLHGDLKQVTGFFAGGFSPNRPIFS
jgi:hypothetical protein